MKILVKFIICGLSSSLLFPPFFILPIGFVIFPFLFFLLINKKFVNQSKFFHFNSGLAFGIGMNFIVFIWIKEPFLIDENTRKFSSFSYLLIIYCSIFYGISFLVLSYFKKNISKLILIPVFFVISEILRENIGYGFPWLTFALVYSGNEYILSLIYYLGTYGLSYLTIFIFLFPVSIILIYQNNNRNSFLKIYTFISVITISLILFFSFLPYEKVTNLEKKFLKITIVQSNLSQFDRSENIFVKDRLNEINKIINENDSDLLIFAENEYPSIISDLDNLKSLTNILNENQTIIIGGTFKNNSEFYNTLFLIEKNNIQYFNKIKLVPFGEFLPFRNILNFLDGIVGVNDYSPGKKSRLLITSNSLYIIPIICYEVIFFNNLLNKENINSTLMINITNDAWFGDLSGPYQHFYLSRMRAIEYNKPIIRVSNNGISAAIDKSGKIIDYISLNKKETKNIKIHFPHISTNLTIYHSLILIFLSILIILSIIINNKIDE